MSKKKEGLPDANRNSPETKDLDHSIARAKKNVKPNLLRELRTTKDLEAKDLVDTVKALYPRFDKTLESKCEHEEYGIDLKRQAMDALLIRYAPELIEAERRRRDGNHKLRRRVSCRLTETEYADLMKQIKADGFDTTQAWLAFNIRHYLKKRH